MRATAEPMKPAPPVTRIRLPNMKCPENREEHAKGAARNQASDWRAKSLAL
jgi:hypothetical protein